MADKPDTAETRRHLHAIVAKAERQRGEPFNYRITDDGRLIILAIRPTDCGLDDVDLGHDPTVEDVLTAHEHPYPLADLDWREFLLPAAIMLGAPVVLVSAVWLIYWLS